MYFVIFLKHIISDSLIHIIFFQHPTIIPSSPLQGTLKGFDQTVNIILEGSHERVFSEDSGVEQVVLGLYVVRGDNIAVIGEVDEDKDASIDLSEVRANPLKALMH